MSTTKMGIVHTSKIGNLLFVCLRNNRHPTEQYCRAVRKALWQMVNNCVRNRSRSDEIDTDTEISTSLKSEFYFRFRCPPSTKSTLISYITSTCVLSNSCLSNATSKRPKFVEKRGNYCRDTAKTGIRTPLKSDTYFRFVTGTIVD